MSYSAPYRRHRYVKIRVVVEVHLTVIRLQVPTREFSLDDNPRSQHCPAIRPGPALGCNFCWNTIDAHGRILRRKTKYHCPECQTNLCIVPCFQEYHERQTQEGAVPTSGPSAARGSSPGSAEGPAARKPSLKLASFGALSSGSMNSASSPSVDSAGSHTAPTNPQQPPDFTPHEGGTSTGTPMP